MKWNDEFGLNSYFRISERTNERKKRIRAKMLQKKTAEKKSPKLKILIYCQLIGHRCYYCFMLFMINLRFFTANTMIRLFGGILSALRIAIMSVTAMFCNTIFQGHRASTMRNPTFVVTNFSFFFSSHFYFFALNVNKR